MTLNNANERKIQKVSYSSHSLKSKKLLNIPLGDFDMKRCLTY